MRRSVRLVTPLLLIAVASVASGCGARTRYERVAGRQTLSDIEASAEAFDHTRWSTIGTDRAAEMRAQALASLRRKDETAALLADVLTSDFHMSRGVPVEARETVVDSKPAWVVIEVYGPTGGLLDRWRLWVLSRPGGDVISSSTYR